MSYESVPSPTFELVLRNEQCVQSDGDNVANVSAIQFNGLLTVVISSDGVFESPTVAVAHLNFEVAGRLVPTKRQVSIINAVT